MLNCFIILSDTSSWAFIKAIWVNAVIAEISCTCTCPFFCLFEDWIGVANYLYFNSVASDARIIRS